MFTLEMGLIDKQSMIYLILQMCTCAYTYMCKNFQFVQTFVHVSSICWSRFEARDDQIACVYLVSSRCLILFVFTCLDVRISKIPLYTHMESHVYSRCFFQYVLFWPIWWAYFSNGLNHQLVFPYTNRKRYLSRENSTFVALMQGWISSNPCYAQQHWPWVRTAPWREVNGCWLVVPFSWWGEPPHPETNEFPLKIDGWFGCISH